MRRGAARSMLVVLLITQRSQVEISCPATRDDTPERSSPGVDCASLAHECSVPLQAQALKIVMGSVSSSTMFHGDPTNTLGSSGRGSRGVFTKSCRHQTNLHGLVTPSG